MKNDKAPEFMYHIVKRFWSLLEEGVIFAILNLQIMGSMQKGCNTLLIILVPKVPNPKFLKDYRPISLIGCWYKIIGKFLANIITDVTDNMLLSNVVKLCFYQTLSNYG